MSAARHDEEAGAETAAAERHEAEIEASTAGASSSAAPADDGPVWTVDASEVEALRADAARHRELAAAHRAAAEALRDAEARACVGLADVDRDQSPFSHRADIAEVSELTEVVPAGRGTTTRVVGATVVIRAVPGLTAEWLTRVIECHLARNAALGHDVPEMADCPLVPAGVTASVRSSGGGFAVDVRAADADGALEVVRRARALVTR